MLLDFPYARTFAVFPGFGLKFPRDIERLTSLYNYNLLTELERAYRVTAGFSIILLKSPSLCMKTGF